MEFGDNFDWSNVKTGNSKKAPATAQQSDKCVCGSENLKRDEVQGHLVCLDCGVTKEGLWIKHERPRNLKDDTGHDKVLGNLELDADDGGMFYTRIGDGDNQFSRTQAAVEDNSSKKDRGVRKLNAEFCARLGLPHDIEVRTMEMYMIISRIKDIKRQKRDDIMIGACLFLVCQKAGRLTLADLCKGTNVDQAKVSRCIMRIRQSADYKKFRKTSDAKTSSGGRSTVMGCAQLIPRYVSELFPPSPFRQKINNLAEEVAQKVANDGLADGKKPNTLAGVIIKLVYDWLKEDPTWKPSLEAMGINFETIGRVVEITSLTMQKTFELLEPHRRKLLPLNPRGDGPARVLPKAITDNTPKITNVLDTSLLN
jgi:transcription initiation factor TFIIIB Brf1 subunit/transcription initiation factor TFIIB